MNVRISEQFAFCAISAQGLHPYGLTPITPISLYKKIVIPIALYGSELWNNMSSSEMGIANKLQHYIVKKIQGFPRKTRSDICESMVGFYKLFFDVIIRKLLFLHKKLSLDINSTTTNILVRRYMQFVTDITVTFGFIPYACNILCKYGLHCFVSNALISCSSMPSQYCWKAPSQELSLN